MTIKALLLSRYRVFKEPARVPIAPITLIIGRNGSGKSVISRLPLLLSDAISTSRRGPLDLLAGNIEHAASYADLVHLRGSLPFSLGLEIEEDGFLLSFETSLRFVNETKSLVIEKFVIRRHTADILSIDVVDYDALVQGQPKYRVSTIDGHESESSLYFRGILPEFNDNVPEPRELIRRTLLSFSNSLGVPSYLGPFRVEPSYFMRNPNQGVRELGPKGERALELLADDRLRHGGTLADEVDGWFAKAMGQGISLDTSGEQPKVVVTDAQRGAEVALSDTGAGLSQCLPVVVQHLALQKGRINAPLLIVEQPELHLHPAAHGALADLIIATAIGSRDGGGRALCMIETHSEQFIMRIRRRIADGLEPSNVKMLSLAHKNPDDSLQVPIKEISFDSSGNPSAWPEGVFEESLSDLKAMRAKNRERGR